MKSLTIILTLFIVFNVVAEEPCEVNSDTSQIEDLANSVSIPNCYSKMKIDLAVKGKLNPLCKVCKEEFTLKYNGYMPRSAAVTSEDKKHKFFDIAFQEYKKILTNNLVEIAKLRTLRPTEANFENSKLACQFKDHTAFKNCSPQVANELKSRLGDLQSKLAGELAQLVAKTQPKNRTTGILDRSSTSNMCFIPERDLMLISNINLEELFTPQIFEAIGTLNPSDFSSTNDMFESLIAKNVPNIQEIRDSFSSHPLLSFYFNSPVEFIQMIKRINPKDVSGLQKTLYSPDHGNSFDKKIAQSCTDAFDILSKSICSEEFNKGDLSLNPFTKLEYIHDDFGAEESEFSVDERLLSKNLRAFQYCEIANSEGSLNGQEKLDSMKDLLYGDLSSYPLKRYQVKKYQNDISSLNEKLCEIKSDEKKCIEGTVTCNIYKRYKKLSDTTTLDSKLAGSSNSVINELLRNFIGNPKDISPETRLVLVQEGILPQSDGTMVAQADIPERQPGYFSKPSTNSAPAPVQKTTIASQPARASRNSQNSSPRQELYNPGAYYENHLASQMPDFSDLLDESDKNLRNVQDEIMRRLSGLPNQRPTSSAQAKQIARDSLKSKGISNSSLESALASRMMATSPSATSNSIPTGSADMFDGERKEVASTSTETAAEKYKKDGMNRALADMYGARQSAGGAGASAGASANGRSPASGPGDAESEKPLSTVALSVPADPRVSLHQVFAEKLNKNDPEAQMLKVLVTSRKNFILQIGQVNFRVVFDKASQMNILLDSGDKDEAQRIRPQLEIFINRLRSI